MNTKIFIWFGGILVLLISGFYVLSHSSHKTSTDSDSVEVNKVTIVTSFYPLQYFTSRITGENAEVVNIGKNSDPHEYTPSVNDMVTIQSADLVLLQGAGLESWGEDAETQLKAKNVPVFVVSENITVHEMEEGEHGHEVEGATTTKEETDHHDHGDQDPHTWLDPVLAADTVSKIVDQLTIIDPKNEVAYRANAASLIAELQGLDTAYKTGFSNCSADEVLVSHDAFGYLSRRYNLIMHPIAGISTQDEPSAKLLVELKAEAEDGVVGILTEENSVKEYAETIARETGITIIPINALESGVIENSGDYMDGMKANLRALQMGYGCQIE